MPHDGPRRPSSKDVAQRAGVSRTTVSFVLNDRPDTSIPESTKQRVLDAAHALGYFPSPEARALRMGSSPIVLCLLPDWPITGPLGVLLKQLSAQLAARGLTMLSHQRDDGEDLTRVLQSTTPTSVLAMCDLDADEAEFARRRGLRLTSWMSDVPGHPDRASLRQSDVGRLQVTALAELGHRSLAYVSPPDRELAWFSEPRLAGARSEAEARGLRLVEVRASEDEDVVRAQLAGDVLRGVSGLCAYNDEIAYGLVAAAHQLGCRVPDDLSVIGVDDSSLSRIARPSISTIAFDLSQEAERLARLVAGTDGDDDEVPAIPMVDALHLVPRQTTARPDAARA